MFPSDTKVLVVDDFKTMRKIVINALKNCGLENVEEADDGATAWPMFEEAAASDKPFSLVISDWNMPKMQGIDFLKNVRAHPAGKATPFVLVTAEAEQSNIVQAVQAGVSNYIVKPFSPADLKTKLEQVYAKVSKG
ncbi:MAG: response regulator [Bdellovibrionales bacterium]|nr:response regulator [Bdellovibrionales bacterium]